jgi:hypothetical protein
VNEVRAAFNYYYAQIYLMMKQENLLIAGALASAGAPALARRHRPERTRFGGARRIPTLPSLFKMFRGGWLISNIIAETKTDAVPISIGNQVLGCVSITWLTV